MWPGWASGPGGGGAGGGGIGGTGEPGDRGPGAGDRTPPYALRVPDLQPFRALRYDTRVVPWADVLAPPYDVVDEEERAELVARHPANAIAVELPVAPDGGDPYRHAARLLERWERDGVLLRDPEPTLTAYRMSYEAPHGGARATTGVLGALRLEAPGDGDILPHEATLPKAKTDRLRLLQSVGANTSPVWGLSLRSGLSALVDVQERPLASARVDGVLHEAWVLPAPRVDAIREAVATAPIVLADGHHRWETALSHATTVRASKGPGPWDFALAYIVELAPEQLDLGPIHRVVPGTVPTAAVLAALARAFVLEPLPSTLPAQGTPDGARDVERLVHCAVELGAPIALGRDGAVVLRPKLAPDAGTDADAGDLRDLDSARLAATLPPEMNAAVAFCNSAAEVARTLQADPGATALLVRAAPVPLVAEVAARRARMPPKSTFFRPKPRTGVVFRPFAERDRAQEAALPPRD